MRNYRELVRRVDSLCETIGAHLAGHLACRKGCDACCLHLSLFPVEAEMLTEAIKVLPAVQQEKLRERATTARPDGPCPLLEDHACLVYQARPMICRTHGLPVLTRMDGEAKVDFCPQNCQELTSLSGDMVIDLERLNSALTAINALFLQETGETAQHRRPFMSEIILRVTGYPARITPTGNQADGC
jgi:Fe-S-cluster containining protein